MSPGEQFRETIERMEDHEILERIRLEQFGDEALAVARSILASRGTASTPVPPAAEGMVVILEGAVGADGLIRELTSLRPRQADESGFVRAALDAVRQWEFTPTRLNNVPTPVTITVTVTFVQGRP